MQSSSGEGTSFEGAGEGSSSSNFNADAPAFSYDEVFPALSQPSATPVPNSVWNTNKPRIGSSTVTQLFVISPSERKVDNSEKFGEKDNLRACTNIMHATNTTIEISADKNGELTFLVTGKTNDVAEAKRRVTAHFQTPSSTTINIPKEYHKKLLGKGGQKLRDLEKATGCKITVPSINDSSETINVTGTRDGVEKAMHEIKVTYDQFSKNAHERVQVPKIYHPFICGGHNERLNQITADTHAKINVPPPSVQNDEITISGDKEGVQAAKDRILAIYHEMESKCNQVSVEVPKSQHKYIIGPKRSTISDILQQTGVSVELPSAEEDIDTITLRGPQEKLGTALTMVYEKANSIMTTTIDAPGWLHKRLRGKKGENIQRISQDSRTHCEFKEETGTIRLEGSPEDVTRVKEELESKIKEYLSTLVAEEITIDQKFSKHIIGKNGSNVNRLKDETGVEINFTADTGTTISLLRFEGPKDGVAKVKAEIQEMISKMENEVEIEVTVDQRLFPSLIGTKGERINEVRDAFKQTQIIFPSQGDKGNIVRLRGPKDEAEKCAKHMKDLVKTLAEDNYSLAVPIYKKFHRFIIGKAGVNIRKIRDETGTRIDLPKEGDDSDDIIITGKQDRVEIARDRIQKIQDEMAVIVTEEITIPSKFHTSLIGAGGKLIHSISEECGGVHIRFPNQDSNSDKVVIRGPKEDVDRAIQQLDQLKNQREASSFTAELKAKPSLHRHLIGKSGSTVRKIRDSTGARIMFPSQKDEDQETIMIMGTKDQVEKAKAELQALITELSNLVEVEMTVDPQYHKHFVARRGAVIQKISDDCRGVTISFPRPNIASDKVVLKGAKDDIETAMKKIDETIRSLESVVTIDCVIPQSLHRTVMGSRGLKVQTVTSDFDVQIKFPERDKYVPANDGETPEAEVNGEDGVRPNDVIKITGQPEDCEKAKEALLALIPTSIQVPVPNKYHRLIIGKGGGGVRRLMDEYDVRINMSPQDEQLDYITITGTPACLELAKEGLIAMVSSFDKDEEERALKGFQVTLDIDPEFHPKIIGRKGAVVNKIREDFDVVITLPKREQPDERVITVTGYEKNALAARDHILSIVNELKGRVKEELDIDSRIHSRLIGQRGRSIRKMMDDFKVDIKFPRQYDSNPNLVVITGSNEDDVQDAKEELLNQAEEYLQDLADSYVPPPANREHRVETGPQGDGFVVRGAPWEQGPQQTPDTASITDFPSFGAAAKNPQISSWGPRR